MTCSVHPCKPFLPVIDKKNTTCCLLDYKVKLISTQHNWPMGKSRNFLAAFKQCYNSQAINVIPINKLKIKMYYLKYTINLMV